MKKKNYLLTILSFLLIFSATAQAKEDTDVQDSLIQKKEQEFLLPTNVYKNITNRVNKQKLLEDLNLTLITHRGGVDYYPIGESLTGLRFVGQLLSEISFRFFGEEGLDYEASMVKAGFVLKKRTKSSSLEIEPGLDVEVLDGEIRIYRKGSIVCQVYDGSYIGFRFYKSTVTK